MQDREICRIALSRTLLSLQIKELGFVSQLTTSHNFKDITYEWTKNACE